MIKKIQSVITEIGDYLSELPPGGVDLIGLNSGFKEMNKLTLGIRPSLMILMGRPSMGKTTFSLNIAENISKQVPVLYFSIEMSAKDVVTKMISAKAKIPFDNIMLGKMAQQDWDNLTWASANLAESDIYFIEESSINVDQIRQYCEEFKALYPNFFVVIDYLQLINSSSGKSWSRDHEVSIISKKLVSIKKDLKIPVLTLAQMNRECEKRQEPRPIMSDLRESGAIEQDADMIMGIYRPARLRMNEEYEGQTFIELLKNRQGRVGEFELQFLEEQQVFIEKSY